MTKIGISHLTPYPLEPYRNIADVLGCLFEMKKQQVEIAILPELWAYGPIPPEKANSYPLCTSHLLETLEGACRNHRAPEVILGSLPEKRDGYELVYNTVFLTTKDGSRPVYRKLNLFEPFGEHEVFTKGDSAEPFQIQTSKSCFKAGAIVCFDLRFPEISRRLVFQGMDILIVHALWPLKRKSHLKSLLTARAIENQCFVALSNPNGICGETKFAGSSGLIDPVGSWVRPVSEAQHWRAYDIEIEAVRQARSVFSSVRPPGNWYYASESKLLELERLLEVLSVRREIGHKIVFTNGCFDILHSGHVQYLEQARSFGDLLVVGLNTDKSVKGIKGPSRPINPQELRARVLSSLWSVDYVVFFDDPTPISIIQKIRPDVLVKGADWLENQIVGADIVKAYGGQVRRIEFQYSTSTSLIIDKILSVNKK